MVDLSDDELLAELGVTQNEMYLKWLRHARKEIEKKLK